MANLTEEIRALLPGRAHSNWSLTEQTSRTKKGWDPEQRKYVDPKPGQVALFDAELGQNVFFDANEFVWQGDPEMDPKTGEYGKARVKRIRAKDVNPDESVYSNARAAMRDVEAWLRQESSPRAANLTEAKATGAGQIALMKVVQSAGSEWVKLSDIPFRQVGLKFEKLMSAAEALAKKGLVDYKVQKGEGNFIRLKSTKESVAGAPGPFAVSDEGSVRDEVADLLDRVRSPRWEYPSWALPKEDLAESAEDTEGQYSLVRHKGTVHAKGQNRDWWEVMYPTKSGRQAKIAEITQTTDEDDPYEVVVGTLRPETLMQSFRSVGDAFRAAIKRWEKSHARG